MLQAHVTDIDNKVVAELSIPQNAHDIPYSQYIDYSIYQSSVFDWLRDKKESGEEYIYEYQILIAKAVSKIWKIDYSIIKNLQFQRQDWLWQAWASIEKIISEFEPDTNGGEFEHNGKKYIIPAINKSIITGEVYASEITFGQLQEINDLKRLLAKGVKEIEGQNKVTIGGKEYENLDAVANATYTSTIQQIALLLADPKEIPTDAKFSRWLDERTIEIKDISTPNALDTIFFFLNLQKGYAKIIGLRNTLSILSQERLEKNQLVTEAQE